MSIRKYGLAAVLNSLLVAFGASKALGVEPTHLEPAEESESERFTLEQTAEWENHDKETGSAETKIMYGLNRRLSLGLTVPVEFESGDGAELGDIGLSLEGVVNPEATTAPLVGGEIELYLPTGDDSEGIGGELQVRLSKYLGKDKKHGLHLNVMGYYEFVQNNSKHDLFDDDDSDREISVGEAAGYTYKVTDRTELIADIYREDNTESGQHETLAEVGLKHHFSQSVSGAVGFGVGLDSDSPDLSVKTGIEFKFGSRRHMRDKNATK